MVKKSKKSKSKRVTLRQKHKVLRKVKEHHRKKRKEAKKEGKAGQRKKVEKDPGIPNEWPFKEQELKALEARRAQALQELELKKEARKERVCHRPLHTSISQSVFIIGDMPVSKKKKKSLVICMLLVRVRSQYYIFSLTAKFTLLLL
jgi:hypothetical protein